MPEFPTIGRNLILEIANININLNFYQVKDYLSFRANRDITSSTSPPIGGFTFDTLIFTEFTREQKAIFYQQSFFQHVLKV